MIIKLKGEHDHFKWTCISGTTLQHECMRQRYITNQLSLNPVFQLRGSKLLCGTSQEH